MALSSAPLILACLLVAPEEAEIAAPVPSEAASATATTEPAPSPAPATPPAAGAGQAADDELIVTGRAGPPKQDPLLGVNLMSYEATQAVDKALIRPAAKTYQRILPNPVRDGIRNIINNLREPVVFVNFLLQLKPGKAIETVGRFTINSTIGAAGAFDFAKRKPFNLPRRPNGLANTLGYYGVKPGPFLFLPLVGPTTIRDAIGDGLDRLLLPLAVGRPFNRPLVGTATYVFSSLDQRAEFDEKLQVIHSDRADPYATLREDYLRSREAAIAELHGRKLEPPKDEEE